MAPAPLSSPTDRVRRTLVVSFHEAHRPELADVVATAELTLDFPGLWLRPEPSFASVAPAWLEERLLAAAFEVGLPVAWVHVVGNCKGREAV